MMVERQLLGAEMRLRLLVAALAAPELISAAPLPFFNPDVAVLGSVGPPSSSLLVTVLSCSGFAVFLILVLACTCCHRTGVRFKEFENTDVEDEEGVEFSPPASELPSSPSTHDVYVLPLANLSHGQQPGGDALKKAGGGVEIRRSLSYIHEIGRGWFGKVLLGEIFTGFSPSRVVVKELRSGAPPDEQRRFLEEAQPYRLLQHPNIMQCLGQCTEASPYLLVMELCSLGDVKAYLRGLAGVTGSVVDVEQLLRMAFEVSAGVTHMHRHGYTHSDLALRSCLLTSDLTVKIGDYGTAATKYKDDYMVTSDRQSVPLRWIAPELVDDVHGNLLVVDQSKQSNVWSLGVTLWELLELGSQPYKHLSDKEVLSYVVKEQQVRLAKPRLQMVHSDRWYEVLQLCWLPCEQRPSVEEVHLLLTYLYNRRLCSSDDASFERQWNALKPCLPLAHQPQAPAYPQLRRFSSEGLQEELDDVLTVTETSQGLSFEYSWDRPCYYSRAGATGGGGSCDGGSGGGGGDGSDGSAESARADVVASAGQPRRASGGGAGGGSGDFSRLRFYSGGEADSDVDAAPFAPDPRGLAPPSSKLPVLAAGSPSVCGDYFVRLEGRAGGAGEDDNDDDDGEGGIGAGGGTGGDAEDDDGRCSIDLDGADNDLNGASRGGDGCCGQRDNDDSSSSSSSSGSSGSSSSSAAGGPSEHGGDPECDSLLRNRFNILQSAGIEEMRTEFLSRHGNSLGSPAASLAMEPLIRVRGAGERRGDEQENDDDDGADHDEDEHRQHQRHQQQQQQQQQDGRYEHVFADSSDDDDEDDDDGEAETAHLLGGEGGERTVCYPRAHDLQRCSSTGGGYRRPQMSLQQPVPAPAPLPAPTASNSVAPFSGPGRLMHAFSASAASRSFDAGCCGRLPPAGAWNPPAGLPELGDGCAAPPAPPLAQAKMGVRSGGMQRSYSQQERSGAARRRLPDSSDFGLLLTDRASMGPFASHAAFSFCYPGGGGGGGGSGGDDILDLSNAGGPGLLILGGGGGGGGGLSHRSGACGDPEAGTGAAAMRYADKISGGGAYGDGGRAERCYSPGECGLLLYDGPVSAYEPEPHDFYTGVPGPFGVPITCKVAGCYSRCGAGASVGPGMMSSASGSGGALPGSCCGGGSASGLGPVPVPATYTVVPPRGTGCPQCSYRCGKGFAQPTDGLLREQKCCALATGCHPAACCDTGVGVVMPRGGGGGWGDVAPRAACEKSSYARGGYHLEACGCASLDERRLPPARGYCEGIHQQQQPHGLLNHFRHGEHEELALDACATKCPQGRGSLGVEERSGCYGEEKYVAVTTGTTSTVGEKVDEVRQCGGGGGGGAGAVGNVEMEKASFTQESAPAAAAPVTTTTKKSEAQVDPFYGARATTDGAGNQRRAAPVMVTAVPDLPADAVAQEVKAALSDTSSPPPDSSADFDSPLSHLSLQQAGAGDSGYDTENVESPAPSGLEPAKLRGCHAGNDDGADCDATGAAAAGALTVEVTVTDEADEVDEGDDMEGGAGDAMASPLALEPPNRDSAYFSDGDVDAGLGDKAPAETVVEVKEHCGSSTDGIGGTGQQVDADAILDQSMLAVEQTFCQIDCVAAGGGRAVQCYEHWPPTSEGPDWAGGQREELAPMRPPLARVHIVHSGDYDDIDVNEDEEADEEDEDDGTNDAAVPDARVMDGLDAIVDATGENQRRGDNTAALSELSARMAAAGASAGPWRRTADSPAGSASADEQRAKEEVLTSDQRDIPDVPGGIADHAEAAPLEPPATAAVASKPVPRLASAQLSDEEEDEVNSEDSEEDMVVYSVQGDSSDSDEDDDGDGGCRANDGGGDGDYGDGVGAGSSEPVPVVVTESEGALSLRSMLRPPGDIDGLPSLEIAEGVRSKKMVSFFDDVTVYLFDEESPTSELGDRGALTEEDGAEETQDGAREPGSSEGDEGGHHEEVGGGGSGGAGAGAGYEWDDEDLPPGPRLVRQDTPRHASPTLLLGSGDSDEEAGLTPGGDNSDDKDSDGGNGRDGATCLRSKSTETSISSTSPTVESVLPSACAEAGNNTLPVNQSSPLSKASPVNQAYSISNNSSDNQASPGNQSLPIAKASPSIQASPVANASPSVQTPSSRFRVSTPVLSRFSVTRVCDAVHGGGETAGE